MNPNFMETAQAAAAFSEDPSTKVGAVVVFDSRVTVGIGCNDFPHSVPKSYWNDRALKYKHVIHAEVVAILQAGLRNCHDATIYVTAHPCAHCARMISAVGIAKVVCPPEPWRDDPAVIATVDEAREIFATCGIVTAYTGDKK